MERALKHHFFVKRDRFGGRGVRKGKDGWSVSQGSTGTRAQVV